MVGTYQYSGESAESCCWGLRKLFNEAIEVLLLGFREKINRDY